MWKEIEGYKNYLVSDEGQIYSKFLGRCLKPDISIFGYKRVSLRNATGAKHFSVHSLVAEAFIGPRPEGLQVNHKDENKLNNQVENLEYVTPKENSNHGTRTERSISKQKIKVFRCDENFNVLAIYPSMHETGFNSGNIITACHGRGGGFNGHKSYGYYWYSERTRNYKHR